MMCSRNPLDARFIHEHELEILALIPPSPSVLTMLSSATTDSLPSLGESCGYSSSSSSRSHGSSSASLRNARLVSMDSEGSIIHSAAARNDNNNSCTRWMNQISTSFAGSGGARAAGNSWLLVPEARGSDPGRAAAAAKSCTGNNLALPPSASLFQQVGCKRTSYISEFLSQGPDSSKKRKASR
jgi:hypothetical protein